MVGLESGWLWCAPLESLIRLDDGSAQEPLQHTMGHLESGDTVMRKR